MKFKSYVDCKTSQDEIEQLINGLFLSTVHEDFINLKRHYEAILFEIHDATKSGGSKAARTRLRVNLAGLRKSAFKLRKLLPPLK